MVELNVTLIQYSQGPEFVQGLNCDLSGHLLSKEGNIKTPIKGKYSLGQCNYWPAIASSKIYQAHSDAVPPLLYEPLEARFLKVVSGD